MYVASWNIDRLGHLRSHQVDGLGPGLNVLFGPNELGKSTIRHFLMWTLVGYPAAQSAVYRRLQPADGAKAGGSVSVHDVPDVGNVTVERWQASSAKPVFTDDFGNIVQVRLPTEELSPELYRAVFSIDAADLQSPTVLDKAQAIERIRSAAFSGASRSPVDVLAGIKSRQRALLGKSGTASKIISSFRDLDSQLQQATAQATGASTLRSQMAALIEQADATATKVDELQRQLARLQRLQALRTDALEAHDARRQCCQLANGSIHGIDSETFDETEQSISTALRRREHLTTEAAATRSIVERTTVDERLCAIYEPAQQAYHEASAMQQRQLRQRELEIECDELRARLHQQLDELGPLWGSQELLSSDTPLPSRPTRNHHISARLIAHQRVDEATRSLAQAQHDAETATAATQKLRQLTAANYGADLTDDELLRQSNLLGTWQALLAQPEPPTQGIRFFAVVALLAGIASCGAGYFGQWPLAVTAAVVCTVLAAHVRTLRSDPRARQIDAIASQFGMSSDTSLQHVSDARRRIDAIRAQHSDLAQLSSQSKEAEETFQRCMRDYSTASREQQEAEEHWRTWTEASGLPTDALPEEVQSLCDTLLAARETHRRIIQCEQRLATQRQQTDADDALLQQLRTQAGLDPTTTVHDIAAAARQATSDLRDRNISLAELERLSSEIAELDQRIEVLQDTRQSMLDQLGVRSGEEFHDVYRQIVERRRLEAKIAEFDRRVTAAFGHSNVPELAEGSLFEWELQQAATKDELTTLQEHRDDLLQQIGSLNERLERQRNTAELAAIDVHRQATIAQAAATHNELVALGLAQAAVEDAIESFATTRQPEVLRFASESFADMTGDRYDLIRIDDDGTLMVRAASGSFIPASVLSSGATEQLYLAVRIGLIRESCSSTAIPVLLDDPFVNADADRCQRVARQIEQLAADTQVLVFTCHERVRELFSARATIIDLEAATRLLTS